MPGPPGMGPGADLLVGPPLQEVAARSAGIRQRASGASRKGKSPGPVSAEAAPGRPQDANEKTASATFGCRAGRLLGIPSAQWTGGNLSKARAIKPENPGPDFRGNRRGTVTGA